MRFYRCNHCGNIIAFVHASGVPVVCCGEQMGELIPNSTDASVAAHLPVISVDGRKVTVNVGATTHPMIPEHSIEWVALQTKQGNQRKTLSPGDAPMAEFMLCEGDAVEAAFAYCNLHGLWKAEG
ncbi:MAG: desulfoferrodoxin [Clostridiales bacterium]|nr:desulfoferrodoxin [Clostridiales bacterium]